GMRAQIPPRQTFQKRFELLPRRGGERAKMVQDLIVRVAVYAFIHAAVEIIGRADVELPKIFGFPWRERFRIDGFDVRIGEQEEHLPELRRADAFGKLRHSARVEDIPPKPRPQILMVLNQKEHGFPVGCGKFQALETLSRYLQAGRNVLQKLDSLAGVVQQDRKIEQFGLVQLAEDAGVAFVPFELG